MPRLDAVDVIGWGTLTVRSCSMFSQIVGGIVEAMRQASRIGRSRCAVNGPVMRPSCPRWKGKTRRGLGWLAVPRTGGTLGHGAELSQRAAIIVGHGRDARRGSAWFSPATRSVRVSSHVPTASCGRGIRWMTAP
jgi:hypothetical protein